MSKYPERQTHENIQAIWDHLSPAAKYTAEAVTEFNTQVIPLEMLTYFPNQNQLNEGIAALMAAHLVQRVSFLDVQRSIVEAEPPILDEELYEGAKENLAEYVAAQDKAMYENWEIDKYLKIDEQLIQFVKKILQDDAAWECSLSGLC